MSLDLNCANFTDEGKGVEIPPKGSKTYPVHINAKSLKEYIQKGGDIIEIPVEESKEREEGR